MVFQTNHVIYVKNDRAPVLGIQEKKESQLSKLSEYYDITVPVFLSTAESSCLYINFTAKFTLLVGDFAPLVASW